MIRFRTFLVLFSISLLLSSCNPSTKEEPANLMIVKGKVEGLRKGTLFLQKIQDTILVNVDSTLVKGTPQFEFRTPIETAEVFYLYLDKEDGDSLNDRILFFGEKGTIEINTLLKLITMKLLLDHKADQYQLLHKMYLLELHTQITDYKILDKL